MRLLCRCIGFALIGVWSGIVGTSYSASFDLGEDVEMEIGGEPYTIDVPFLLDPEEVVIEARIDWGDGEMSPATLVEDGQRIFALRTFVLAGNYVVTVELETSTGVVSDTVTVRASKVAPVVDALGDKVMEEGRRLSLEGVPFFGAGVLDGYTASVDWGDGMVEAMVVDGERQEVSASHVYETEGPFSAEITVGDGTESGRDAFTVFPPLRVTSVATGVPAEVDLAWSGGGPPYRVLRSDGLGEETFERFLQTVGLAARAGVEPGGTFFKIESDPGAPPIEIEVEVEVQRGEGDAESTVTGVLMITDSGTGEPTDLEGLLAEAGIGQGHQIRLEPVRSGVGVFGVEFTTDLGGPGEILVGVPGTGAEAVKGFMLPPGEIVEMQVSSGPFVFPDGVTPFTVTVAAVDEVGNPAGPGASDYRVESELPFTFEYLESGQAEFYFTSVVPGVFTALITDLVSGLSTEVELLFPVAGPRNFLESPTVVELDEEALLTVPVELFLAPGWDFREAVIDVFFDDAMGEFAGLDGVVDGDEEDGVSVLGFEEFPVAGGRMVSVQLSGAPPLVAGTATLHVVFDTALGNGGGADDKGGMVSIEGIRSETVHPLFDSTEVPVDEDTTTVLIADCKVKAMKVGHVIYVRTSLKTGKKGKVVQKMRADREICDAHNKANAALAQACIFFKKTILAKPVKGKALERDIFSKLGEDDKKAAAIAKQIGGIMDGVALVLAKEKISRRKEVCKKKVVDCIVVTLFNHDILGALAVANEKKCAVLIESQEGESPALLNCRSLAHELVHVLGHGPPAVGGGGHARKANNLMTPTGKKGVGTFLLPVQIALIRKSKYLADCRMKVYGGEVKKRRGI